ncbi:MAG: substrate-binding domain-containing protein [Myxococcota bacterium]|nr:substrate-binding domain-containing protein [Myxococcota bacterium]
MGRFVWVGWVLVLIGAVAPAAAGERLRLATTTSTENSGLLAELLPHFEATCDCKVDVIAVGTGQALEMGKRGDVDLVMVHAPDLERTWVADGHGVDRRTFMQNDFVILGPTEDPAGVGGGKDGAAALKAVRAAGATFVSRGDQSGTHHREQALWAAAEVEPDGDGYLEAGQGMGAVLVIANEKRGYTLSDRGTWLARKHQLELAVLVEDDPALLNPYSAIAVNPERHPHVKAKLARQLMDWLCGADTQGRIRAFRVGGEPLFTPLLLGGAD